MKNAKKKKKQSLRRGRPDFKWSYLFTLNPLNVFKNCAKVLKENGYEVTASTTEGDFIYAPGDIPVLLVAHVDTVHDKLPKVYQDKDRGVLWSYTGLGADDRAGVAAILDIVSSGLRPHVLFCNYEESGGRGAKLASLELNPEVSFVIEFDRQGSEDSVFYRCDNMDFENYINELGFKTAFGSFSDISILCPEWGVAGVNLSIGYYHAHTESEILVLKQWEETVTKAKVLLSREEFPVFEYDTFVYEEHHSYDYSFIPDINAQLLADMMGGNARMWAKWLVRHEDDLRIHMQDALEDIIYDYASRYIPDELWEDAI